MRRPSFSFLSLSVSFCKDLILQMKPDDYFCLFFLQVHVSSRLLLWRVTKPPARVSPVMGALHAAHFLAYRLLKHLTQNGRSPCEVKVCPARGEPQLQHRKQSRCHTSPRYVSPPLVSACSGAEPGQNRVRTGSGPGQDRIRTGSEPGQKLQTA